MEQRKKESGIRLEDVAAGYGRKSLLNHISLHVSPGNVLTLIGPNGAGKSTILKTVTRQLAELGGTIFLEGTSMSRMREEEVARTLAMVMTERLPTGFMNCRGGASDTARCLRPAGIRIPEGSGFSPQKTGSLWMTPCSWCMPGTPRTGIFHRSATDRDSG